MIGSGTLPAFPPELADFARPLARLLAKYRANPQVNYALRCSDKPRLSIGSHKGSNTVGRNSSGRGSAGRSRLERV